MKKLTRAERTALCQSEDATIKAYLSDVESGRIGALYQAGRGASLEPRADATLVSYAGTLSRLRKHLGSVSWPEVTEELLQSFIDLEGRSANTARQNRACLRGFFLWLVDEEVFTAKRNPARFLRAPKAQPSKRPPVADHIWLQVMGSAIDPDDRLSLGLGYYCGLRREEIGDLRPEQVDPMHKRILFIERKGGKTKDGLEYGELVGVLCDKLPHLAPGAQDWVQLMEFYAKYRQGEPTLVPDGGVQQVGQRLSDRLEHKVFPAAGLPADSFTYHMLRHSFGTNMALAGVEDRIIADQMSHSDRSTTEGYIHGAGQIAAWRKRNAGSSAAAQAWAERTGRP